MLHLLVQFQNGIDPQQRHRSQSHDHPTSIRVSLCIGMFVHFGHDTIGHEKNHGSFVQKLTGSSHGQVKQNGPHPNQGQPTTKSTNPHDIGAAAGAATIRQSTITLPSGQDKDNAGKTIVEFGRVVGCGVVRFTELVYSVNGAPKSRCVVDASRNLPKIHGVHRGGAWYGRYQPYPHMPTT